MPYRDSDRLGPKTSEHRLSTSGGGSWIGAAVLGAVFCPLFLYLALSGRDFSPKLLVGGVVMGGFAFYAFAEWQRLKKISIALHSNGIAYSSAEISQLEVPWSEIRALEGRYVPGLRKRGPADEGNRVTLLVATAATSFTIPKEIEGARDLWKVIEEKSGCEMKKVLVQNTLSR